METDRHQRLKECAIQFLTRLGAAVIGREVRCPISRYLVDVASYIDRVAPEADPQVRAASGTLWNGDTPADRPRTVPARTVFIECKQSRADFLRDCADQKSLLDERSALLETRERIEREVVQRREPELRRSGTFLFDEMEEWAYEASRSGPYRRVQRRLRNVEKRLYGQTKFSVIARYRLADRLYICAPRGMIRPRELPDGWGLLEVHHRALNGLPCATPVAVRTKAPEWRAPERFRERTLRNIASAATREMLRTLTPADCSLAFEPVAGDR